MEKSPDAFRTISEVSDDLDLPQHVLRFWETRFQQIRPLKRAGGRRYYRPTDIVLLRAIRQLLYDEGYTIKGVQRLLKEQGAKGLGLPHADLAMAIEPSFGDMFDEPVGVATGEDRDEGAGPTPTPGPDESLPCPRPDSATVEADDPETVRASIHDALALIESCAAILEAVRVPRS